MQIKPIAHIKTDYKEKFGIPRQSGRSPSSIGKIVFEKEFNRGTPSAEANICLSCPLPECKKSVCKRFNEEKRKIKEKC